MLALITPIVPALRLALGLLMAAPGAAGPNGEVVLRAFDPPAQRWSPGHRGVDIRADSGDPVRAWASGRVGFAGTIAGKPVVTVVLSGPGHLRHTYEPVVAAVARGAFVRSGDLLGYVASAGGHCGGTAGCVHVGLRTDSAYLDPLAPTPAAPPVLKPWDEPGRR